MNNSDKNPDQKPNLSSPSPLPWLGDTLTQLEKKSLKNNSLFSLRKINAAPTMPPIKEAADDKPKNPGIKDNSK